MGASWVTAQQCIYVDPTQLLHSATDALQNLCKRGSLASDTICLARKMLVSPRPRRIYCTSGSKFLAMPNRSLLKHLCSLSSFTCSQEQQE